MPFRVWVGFWTALFLLIVVAFDLSALVRYITRFTEDSFACLIALIFIYQAFRQTFAIAGTAPVHTNPESQNSLCFCVLPNSSTSNQTTFSSSLPLESPTVVSLNDTIPDHSNNTVPDLFSDEGTLMNMLKECSAAGGVLLGDGCDNSQYVPDVFFFSLILFVGTFALALALVKFRNSLFFPTWVGCICYLSYHTDYELQMKLRGRVGELAFYAPPT